MDSFSILLKKWELLWNHYKFQDEMQERRRNFLWIMQVFVFTGFYYTLNKPYILTYINLIIPFFGIFINVAMLIVLKRRWLLLFLTEQAIRDVETQLSSFNINIEFAILTLERKIFFEGKSHKWPNTPETFEKQCGLKINSTTLWLNKIIPCVFLAIWSIISLYNLVFRMAVPALPGL